jgi:hypothetical protein
MGERWLIDDRGELFADTPWEIAARLKTTRSGASLHAFAVECMGFVLVARSQGRAYVAFARDAVSPIALAGLLHWLSEHRPSAVCLQHPGQSTVLRILARKDAIAFFSSCIDERTTDHPFISNPVPLERSPFYDRWRCAREICSGLADSEDRDRLLDAMFGGLFLLSRVDADTGDAVIQCAGSGIRRLDPEFYRGIRGKTFRQAFDTDFGRWSAAEYRRYALADQPIASELAATIRWPNARPRVHRYCRMLVPFRTGTADRWLLTTTVDC